MRIFTAICFVLLSLSANAQRIEFSLTNINAYIGAPSHDDCLPDTYDCSLDIRPDLNLPSIEMPRNAATVHGYDHAGRLVFLDVLDYRDCVPVLYACAAKVDAAGGGLCKVPPGSLVLGQNLDGNHFTITKIAIEGK